MGEALCALYGGAQREALLVAPFMKRDALARVVEQLRPDVHLRCVTRWAAEEVLAGVSDLEVWPLLCSRGNSSLSLYATLHAKYYRADDLCLVGSANITDTALGWRPLPNLELLVPLAAASESLKGFEDRLSQGSVEVTEELYSEFAEAVERLRAMSPPAVPVRVVSDSATSAGYKATEARSATESVVDLHMWIPRLRHPENLFWAYAGECDRMTSTSRVDAAADLACLSVPPGLTQLQFNLHVWFQLLQMPVVCLIDSLVGEPQRFGAIRNFLRTLPCADAEGFDPSEAWQRLMRWLLHFGRGRYVSRVANYSEIFWRRPAK